MNTEKAVEMASGKITTVVGTAFHLPGNEIDTDRIIPADYLRCVTFDNLGRHVFENDRKQLEGKHPFDDPANQECKILVADVNFGCGSSREHAVQAIQRWGIKGIIAPSFAMIFRGNATATGLVCVDVTPTCHQAIVEYMQETKNRNGTNVFCIDLQRMEIHVGNENISEKFFVCDMPSADRDMLINNKWDTTTTLLEAGKLIEDTAARLGY